MKYTDYVTKQEMFEYSKYLTHEIERLEKLIKIKKFEENMSFRKMMDTDEDSNYEEWREE